MFFKKILPRLLIFSVVTLVVLIAIAGSFFLLSPSLKKWISPKRSPFVSATDTKLYLNGEPYQFAGINAFQLGGLSGVNAGCGSPVEDIDRLFSQFRPNTVVRTWAFQGGMAVNTTTKQLDWRSLDRIVNAAQSKGIKLILTLSDQSGTCDDGHWKDRSWYQEGYKTAVNDLHNGLTPLPYLEYVKQIVSRYKDSTAIALWEPINEPEASDCQDAKGVECHNKKTCTDEEAAKRALRTFFDTIGSTIKQIDPNHLVGSGVIGSGQCGASYEDYAYIHQSPGIDVASYHDYDHDDTPMPGDTWNGLQKRLNQMKVVNKPLIVGEAGIKAKDNDGSCMGYQERKEKLQAKMDAQFQAGIVGFLPWSYTGGKSAVCNFDIVENDPLLPLLHDYPVPMGSFTPQPSNVPFYTFSPPPSPFVSNR